MKQLVVICFLMLLFSCNIRSSYQHVPYDGKQVSIDIRTLKEAAPAFYSVMIEGKRIDFFVVLLNGEVSSYFDACKECYTKKGGYRCDGGAMICKTCNVRFPLDKLDTGIGGCYPIKIQGKIQGKISGRIRGNGQGAAYILDKEAIEAGLKYF